MAADCVSRLAKLNTGLDIVIVLRKGEAKSYSKAIRGVPEASIEELPGIGIGYTRHKIMKMAHEEVVIMLDDDKTVKGDIQSWIKVAARDDAVSVGAWQSIYGLYCSGTAIAKGADSGKTFLHRGVMGNQVVALNRQNVLEAGNYPPGITFMEDHELCRQTMANLGLPWMIYAGVTGGSIKPTNQTRGEGQGGNSRSEVDRHYAHQYCHDKWPQYVSHPSKRYQCKWKEMVRHCIRLRGGQEIDNMTTKKEWDWEMP
jgi:hypothetical protein